MNTGGNDRFSVLVCIDGSDESCRGLHYAARFGLDRSDTDITLLYVRPSRGRETHSGQSSSALIDVGRLPLQAWHFAGDPATLAPLQKARDMLVEIGFLALEWRSDGIIETSQRIGAVGQQIRYTSRRTGQSLSMILRDADLVLTGILNEARFYDYDVVIVAPAKDHCNDACIDTYTAIGVATEHDGTVILVRDLQQGHGHFVCVNNTETSMKMVRKNAQMARRSGCSIHLYAVAHSESRLDAANRALAQAEQEVGAAGLAAGSSVVEIGDPVWRIIERGRNHSLIVLSGTEKSALTKLIAGSVSHSVLQKARSSVMIVR